METVNRPYGKVLNGHTIPYGTLAEASYELRKAYYYEGYPKDTDLPDLPVWEPEPEMVELDDLIFAHEAAAAVTTAIADQLNPREAKIICMRFGIGCDEMTLDEVGQTFGVTRERIRQIEVAALRKLKHPLRCPELYAFRIPYHGW